MTNFADVASRGNLWHAHNNFAGMSSRKGIGLEKVHVPEVSEVIRSDSTGLCFLLMLRSLFSLSVEQPGQFALMNSGIFGMLGWTP